MARIRNGILDSFSGTVGTVVGSNWRDIDYMRSKSRRRGSFNPTDRQLKQQVKFALATKLVKTLTGLFEITFRSNAGVMTGANDALSAIIKNATIGELPNVTLVYSQVPISRGSIPGVPGATALSTTPAVVTFNWMDNSNLGKALASDKSILVAYCPELDHAVYTTAGALRSAGTGTLAVTGLSGKVIQTWISFISADGKEIGASVFTGQVTVA